MRSGFNATVNVSADPTFNAANPDPATITIIGAANADVINLASGNDIVTLGSTQETAHGGSGNDTFNVTAATIGATIDGGTGQSALDVTGGGTVTMGANITRIATVLLAAASDGLQLHGQRHRRPGG